MGNQNGQARETGNIGYSIRRKTTTTKKQSTIFVGHHYMQTNTNNVYKKLSLPTNNLR